MNQGRLAYLNSQREKSCRKFPQDFKNCTLFVKTCIGTVIDLLCGKKHVCHSFWYEILFVECFRQICWRQQRGQDVQFQFTAYSVGSRNHSVQQSSGVLSPEILQEQSHTIGVIHYSHDTTASCSRWENSLLLKVVSLFAKTYVSHSRAVSQHRHEAERQPSISRGNDTYDNLFVITF